MPDVVTFDPTNLRIVEITTGGDNELDILEVYSEWKAWLLADQSRLAYPQAFRFAGGDPISGTESLGSTYFLLNGWRIRPAEHSHRLSIVGNLYTDPAGEDPVVATLGTFNVRVLMRVSNIIDQLTIDTGGTFTADDRTKLVAIHTDRYLAADRTTLNQIDANTVNTFDAADRTMLEEIAANAETGAEHVEDCHAYMMNRMRIDVTAQKLILYEADGLTVRATWSLVAHGGGPLVMPTGTQVERAKQD